MNERVMVMNIENFTPSDSANLFPQSLSCISHIKATIHKINPPCATNCHYTPTGGRHSSIGRHHSFIVPGSMQLSDLLTWRSLLLIDLTVPPKFDGFDYIANKIDLSIVDSRLTFGSKTAPSERNAAIEKSVHIKLTNLPSLIDSGFLASLGCRCKDWPKAALAV